VAVGHSSHTAAPSRPYRPAGHMLSVRVTDPAAHACPAAQGPVHEALALPPVPYRPAGHVTHPVAPALPLYWPGGQGVQEAAPSTAAKVPAGHCAQAPPSPTAAQPARQRTVVVLAGGPVPPAYWNRDHGLRWGKVPRTAPVTGSWLMNPESATMMLALYATPPVMADLTSVPHDPDRNEFITNKLVG
jgi:hypothetical protein